MKAPIMKKMIEGAKIEGGVRGDVEKLNNMKYITIQSLSTNHAVIKVVHQLTGETLLKFPQPTPSNAGTPLARISHRELIDKLYDFLTAFLQLCYELSVMSMRSL